MAEGADIGISVARDGRAANLSIRRYRPGDAEAVRSLHRRALEGVGAYAGCLDRDLDDIEGAYLEGDGEFLVGTVSGAVVAMGALRRVSGDEAEVTRMRVEPGFQRRGFGRRMLVRLEERAVELGFSVLTLDTAVRQTGARRLYEGDGFRQTGRGRLGPFDSLFYEKRLESGPDAG